jgi:NADH-quinone oxidoreductase subunit J
MPALLPDGTPSELSVNPIIAARTDTAERHADLSGGTQEDAMNRDVAAFKAATDEAEEADAESRSVKSGTAATGGGASEGEAGQ